jgi:hypothetical protein
VNKEPNYKFIQIGDKFNRWTVIGLPFPQTRNIDGVCEWMVPCRCICGFARPIRVTMLFNGHSRSCGCLKGEKNIIHGEAGKARTRLYRVWYAMKARCTKPYSDSFKDYGARGIQICQEWQNSFIAFRDWANNSGYSPDLELDRIDNNGNYCPENCRWITGVENKRNTSKNVNLSAFGEVKCLTDWSKDERCKISRSGLVARIRSEWMPENAITTPPMTPFEKGRNFHKLNSSRR